MPKSLKSSTKDNINLLILFLLIIAMIVVVYAFNSAGLFSFLPKAAEQSKNRYSQNVVFGCMEYCGDLQPCAPGLICSPNPLEPGGNHNVCLKQGHLKDNFCGEADRCKVSIDPNARFNRIGDSRKCKGGYGEYISVTGKCCPTCEQRTFGLGGNCFTKGALMGYLLHSCHGCYIPAKTSPFPTVIIPTINPQ